MSCCHATGQRFLTYGSWVTSEPFASRARPLLGGCFTNKQISNFVNYGTNCVAVLVWEICWNAGDELKIVFKYIM